MKYLQKQIFKNIGKNKNYIFVLFLLVFFTSFMYFSIEFSIDGNDKSQKEYTKNQNREQFRFNVNIFENRNIVNKVVKINSISDEEIKNFGEVQSIKRKKLDLIEYENEVLESIMLKYGIQYEIRNFKKICQNDKTYFFINKTRMINKAYLVDGKLPTKEDEIALIPAFMSKNNIKINDEINILDTNYKVTASAYLPDYQAFIINNSIEKDYDKSSFVLCNNSVFEKIGVDSYYYAGVTNDENYKIVNTMKSDKELQNFVLSENINSDSQFQMSMDSNKSLALTFLIVLTLIVLFVFYMFFKRFTYLYKQEFGCYLALGYSRLIITKIFVKFSFIISTIGCLLGFAGGYFASSILINRYKSKYLLPNFTKEIDLDSIINGIVIIILLSCIITFISIYYFLKDEAASLLGNYDSSKDLYIVKLISNKIIDKLPKNLRLSMRVVIRKANALILGLMAILCVSILLVMSFSLFLSSEEVVKNLKLGVNYKYDYNTKEYNYDDLIKEKIYYIKENISIVKKNEEKLDSKIIALSHTNNIFKLLDEKNNEINLNKIEGVVINKSLAYLYDFKIGDNIEFELNDKKYIYKIDKVSINGENNSIYIRKDNFCSSLNISSEINNGFFSKNKIEDSNYDLITTEEKFQSYEKNSSSNKDSGIINQVIGIFMACLLLYLIIQLNFEDSINDIKILKMLGYKAKEINNILIDVYKPIFIIFYIITLPIAIYITQSITKSISIQTNDFIPFTFNIFVGLIIFLIIILVYSVIVFLFKRKIARM